MFIFFYFYYLNKLYDIPDIQNAFKHICLNKMLSDGYFDMSVYIFGRIRKDDMYASLVTHKSKYAVLYQGRYPNKDTAASVWRKKIGEAFSNSENDDLTDLESNAIVNWVYRTLKTSEDRQNFTIELFKQFEELYCIQNDIRFARGVVYNAAKVDIHFSSTVSSVNRFISSIGTQTGTLFFRGHANPNYMLQPSILRTPQLSQNESKLYNELMINCPQDFDNCHSHLEVLAKMQHYGLPTRLLDITRNPLVAMYFACSSHPEAYGEIILISAEKQDIKYPKSDTVSILASLPVFTYHKQQEYYRLASDPAISADDFNIGVSRLIHEVQLEKPAFQAKIEKSDILNNYIVYALKNNSRIVKQDGAFILCGLSPNASSLEKFRYTEHGKKIVVLIDKKEKVLKQLETFSINSATLFPEIECVAEYLKNKYVC